MLLAEIKQCPFPAGGSNRWFPGWEGSAEQLLSHFLAQPSYRFSAGRSSWPVSLFAKVHPVCYRWCVCMLRETRPRCSKESADFNKQEEIRHMHSWAAGLQGEMRSQVFTEVNLQLKCFAKCVFCQVGHVTSVRPVKLLPDLSWQYIISKWQEAWVWSLGMQQQSWLHSFSRLSVPSNAQWLVTLCP